LAAQCQTATAKRGSLKEAAENQAFVPAPIWEMTMRGFHWMALAVSALGIASAIGSAATALAQANPAAPKDGFFKDKQIKLVLSTGVAGGYAAYGRLMTQYLGNYLPGNPTTFVVQSMPGGGGLRATNWLYAQGPKDGTTLGMIHSTAPLAPLYGAKGAQFDPRNFVWIGSMNSAKGLCVAWHDSPIQTWDDMKTKQFIVGSSGAGSQMEVLPTMMNKFLGTKIKIIAGYKDGTDIFLAMERGEVQGRCGGLLTVMQLTHPDWLPEHKVVVPIQFASERNPLFPDSPTVLEFTDDPLARQVFELAFATQDMDRPVLAPPGLPEARVKDLRAAFDATMSDPAFIEEAKHQNLDMNRVSGEAVAAIIAKAYAMPPAVIDAARELMGSGGGE
jgi:tripartite-type tricarboxylate transporter receptor subunit TctC